MQFKILPFVLGSLSLLFCSNSLLAQVKIGTNPTVIESSSNLEVEGSTAGRKFKIDKATGKVTIADGTQEDLGVLVTDANGNTRWSKLTPSSLYSFPLLWAGGASTGELVDGVRINLTYPNLQRGKGGYSVPLNGVYEVLYEGAYLVETTLTIENSEGCTGSSSMGLEVSLVNSGVVSPSPIVDERLTPVYQDKYMLKASVLTNVLYKNYLSFSVLPTIKSPQPGCVVKIIDGNFKMHYLP